MPGAHELCGVFVEPVGSDSVLFKHIKFEISKNQEDQRLIQEV